MNFLVMNYELWCDYKHCEKWWNLLLSLLIKFVPYLKSYIIYHLFGLWPNNISTPNILSSNPWFVDN